MKEKTDILDIQNEPEEETLTDAEEIIALMKMRADIYRLFSALYFREVTDEQIKFFRDADMDGMGELDPNIEEGVSNIKHALHHLNSGTREDLAVDFAHTFLASGSTKSETRACPYESVFTSHEGLIMQEARDDVYHYMLNEHLEPDENLHIPDDHVAFVFEFMASLSERVNVAIQTRDKAEAVRLVTLQHEFFDKHIGNWINRLCDSIEKCCRTRFYRGVSQMTRGFVNVERTLLPELEKATKALRNAQEEDNEKDDDAAA